MPEKLCEGCVEKNRKWGPNFMAWTIFFDFQNAGRQDATRESITGDDSLTEYCV